VTGRSFALVAALAFLWGASFPILKVAVETIPPFTVTAVRAVLGGLLLLAFLGRDIPLLWRSGISGSTYFVQGIFNSVLPWTLVAWASRTIDASLVTILNSLSPIFTFLITWAITRHEPATGRKFAGVLLGIAGVVVIIGVDALAGVGRHTLAELACVGGSLAYAMAAVLGIRFGKVTPLVPAAGATLMSVVILVPLALVVEQPWTVQPSMRSVLAVLALAVFSTGAALYLYFRLLSTIGSIATTSQAYLRILVGVGLGVTLLGEPLTWTMVIGMVLVMSGVVAMTLPARRPG
jgi:drug/metabolite transporter (DMT)-like permease